MKHPEETPFILLILPYLSSAVSEPGAELQSGDRAMNGAHRSWVYVQNRTLENGRDFPGLQGLGSEEEE